MLCTRYRIAFWSLLDNRPKPLRPLPSECSVRTLAYLHFRCPFESVGVVRVEMVETLCFTFLIVLLFPISQGESMLSAATVSSYSQKRIIRARAYNWRRGAAVTLVGTVPVVFVSGLRTWSTGCELIRKADTSTPPGQSGPDSRGGEDVML